MHFYHSFLSRHSQVINIIVGFTLLTLILICIIFLIIIYFRASLLNIDRLVHPPSASSQYWPSKDALIEYYMYYNISSFNTNGGDDFALAFKPHVVVTILVAILTGSTYSFISRCVEHDLWQNLSPEPKLYGEPISKIFWDSNLTVGETRRLAQWTISPVARLFYVLDGRSWFLKFGGFFMLGLTIMNPILLYGIQEVVSYNNQIEYQDTKSIGIEPVADIPVPESSKDNSYSWMEFREFYASITRNYLYNYTITSPWCSNSTCYMHGKYHSQVASCNSSIYEYEITKDFDEVRFKSGVDERQFVSLGISTGNGSTLANFTNGKFIYETCQTFEKEFCEEKYFRTIEREGWYPDLIVGAWISRNETIEIGRKIPINWINCNFTPGFIDITQRGLDPLVIRHDNLVPWNDTAYCFDFFPDYNCTENIYTFTPSIVPIHFEALTSDPNGTRDMAYTTRLSSLGSLLIGKDGEKNVDYVARKIEEIHDEVTKVQFVTYPGYSRNVTLTYLRSETFYKYDPMVLLILLCPLLSILLACWDKLYFVGDDVCIGYDPINIARRGPVEGLDYPMANSDEVNDEVEVWGKMSEDEPRVVWTTIKDGTETKKNGNKQVHNPSSSTVNI